MKRIIGSVDNFPAPLWSEVLSRRSHASLCVDRHPYTLREAHYCRHERPTWTATCRCPHDRDHHGSLPT